MLRKALFAIGILILFLPFQAGAKEVPLEQWMPWSGDRLMVNTKENIGYLVHVDGTFTSFPVATGQRRTVRYIGMTYFAATPERTWKVESLENKGKSVTFGATGRFLRLTYGKEKTKYGIHGHRDIAVMLGSDDRYRSMGCILVSEEVLNVLERTFNDVGAFDVITAVKKLPPPFAADVLSREG
ncbi:MAG: L,D-transpeptidase [Patescibacteria group bacterium]